MSRKSVPQVIASAFMLLLGFGGWKAVALRNSMFSSRANWPKTVLAFIPLAFFMVMGAWGLILAFTKPSDTEQEIPGFLRAYADAWKKVLRSRWILWLIGTLILMSLLSALGESALSWHYFGAQFTQLRSTPVGRIVFKPFQFPSIVSLLNTLPREIMSAISLIFPHIAPSQSLGMPGFVDIVFLITLPWVNKRLKALEEVSEHASDARLFRKLIVPTALICIVSAASYFYELRYSYAMIAKNYSLVSLPEPGYLLNISSIITALISWLIGGLLLGGALIGGLAGSLSRTSKHEGVTAESFFTDAFRFFKPIAGVLLVMGIISVMGTYFELFAVYTNGLFLATLLLPGSASILLMFAPFAIADGVRCVRGGLSESIRAWGNCGYNLLAFTALGLSGLTILQVLKSLVPRTPSSYLLQVGFAIPTTILDVCASVFMAVAVWEFYQQIRAFSEQQAEEV